MKNLKTKIIFILAMILYVNLYSQQYSISGPTNVCYKKTSNCSSNTATKFKYYLNGFPSGATNIQVTWVINGAVVCQSSGNWVEVIFDNGCGGSADIGVASKSYYNGQNTITSGPLYPSYNVITNTLEGNITQNGTWNLAPYKCNTNSLTYCINPVCGASSYQWSIPTGWTAQTPLNGTCISVVPDANTGGLISVTAFNNANGCALSTNYSQVITRPVEAPVFVSSLTSFCLPNNPNYTFAISAVPNAISYNWTTTNPWSLASLANLLQKRVDFNNAAKSGNLCVSANLGCGGTSAVTCLNITTFATIPTVPSTAPLYTVASTINANKKSITFKFPSYSTPYTWSSHWSNSTLTQTGGNSGSVNYIMTNNQTVFINYNAANSCGNSIPIDGYLYKLVNGAIVPQALMRMAITNEITDAEKDIELKIFPNPTSDNININYFSQENDNMSIVITDVVGNIILSESYQLNEGENNINLQLKSVSNGIYFLNLDSKDFSKKEKIVIEK